MKSICFFLSDLLNDKCVINAFIVLFFIFRFIPERNLAWPFPGNLICSEDIILNLDKMPLPWSIYLPNLYVGKNILLFIFDDSEILSSCCLNIVLVDSPSNSVKKAISIFCLMRYFDNRSIAFNECS